MIHPLNMWLYRFADPQNLNSIELISLGSYAILDSRSLAGSDSRPPALSTSPGWSSILTPVLASLEAPPSERLVGVK